MYKRISDLGGLGEIVRQLRLGLMGAVYHRSNRRSRALRDEAKQLTNDEQRLKNQERQLKYVKDLLGLSKTHHRTPEELQELIEYLNGSGQNATHKHPAKTSVVVEPKLLNPPPADPDCE